ncbi:bactericidal permeability-increasing protein [Brachyhypopomus gauderio]|uniref:bactericidal permeability-increasing protein n=1 Tax=Brachyhypopomus gauderio TaxID=698409 RepID=UPI004042A214
MYKMRLLALLLVTVTHTHANYPALQAVLSQNGLRKVSHWMTDWLQSKLSTIKLPDVRGDVDIKIGTIHYLLYDMSVQRCDLPEPSVAFSEGTGVALQVDGLSIAINGLWKTHFGLIHDSGWFSLAVYNVNLSAVLELDNNDGCLSILTPVCSADVGYVQANFHGGGSFFFQPFVEMFSSKITDKIREKICPAFKKGIEDVDGHLAAMSDAINMDPYVFMNISLTDSPIVMDSALRLNITGEFYSKNFSSEPPFSPSPFQLPWQNKYMLSVGMSEFCINSASYAYLKSGVLKILIKDDMIPKTFPLHLNTSQFGFLIPQLPKLYPNLTMQTLLYASETPLFSFTETAANFHLLSAAKFTAIKSDAEVPLFRLDMDCSFSAKAYIDKQLLKGFLVMKNLTVTLGSSDIGDFSITPIKNTLTLALTKVVLPKVNAQLKDGLPLPFVKGFILRNSVMNIENGFVTIGTDIDLLH